MRSSFASPHSVIGWMTNLRISLRSCIVVVEADHNAGNADESACT